MRPANLTAPARPELAGNRRETDLAVRLAAIWRELLGLDDLGYDDNYFDLGGDSALAVQLFSRIERELGQRLPAATLFEAPTIHALAKLLAQAAPADAWSPLVLIQPGGPRPPLFCIHDGSGEVLVYRALAHALGADQPVYGLQADPAALASPDLRVEALAARYLREIRKILPHGPYFLAGYCGGGNIAYEIACQLRALGEPVALLALLDAFNWSQLPARSKLWKFWFECERFIYLVRNYFRLGAHHRRRFLTNKIRVIVERLRAVPARGFKQVWRADLDALKAALAAYRPPSYPGPIVDVRPMVQHRALRHEGAKWARLGLSHQLLVLPVYPAGMLIDPFVEHLAASLRQLMDRALVANS